MEVNERLQGFNELLKFTEQTKNNRPWFTAEFTREGQVFTGEGESKQVAKQEIATKLLPHLPPKEPKEPKKKPWASRKRAAPVEGEAEAEGGEEAAGTRYF